MCDIRGHASDMESLRIEDLEKRDAANDDAVARDFFETLPDEILVGILSLLSRAEVAGIAARLNQRFYRLSKVYTHT